MQGDPEAFASLVYRWQGSINRLCCRMVGDTHRAEDLTQEAFARLFAHRARYEASARFSTYLWQIALNLCRDELRRRGRRREDSVEPEKVEDLVAGEAMAYSSALPPDAQLSASEQAHEVRVALETLPERFREVLVLRHYEGLKFREIADVLDVPEGTVKSRMAEALDRMGRLLARPSTTGGPDAPAREDFIL
jgi:RNA polymerase sigma-70 factor (ECF subfamily)